MEVITGVAPAEYGDKSSLVVHIVTKSGLDQPKPTGSVSVRLWVVQQPVVRRQHRCGLAHGRQLPVGQRPDDRSISRPAGVHRAARPRQQRVVLRSPRRPHRRDVDTFHLNVQAARSSFDVPNTYDQNDAGQNQHQKIDTFNVAPGYSHVIGSSTLLTANGFVRRDHLDLHAERRSVRRHARHRVAGPPPDEHRRQGRSRVHRRRAQREARRRRSARRNSTRSSRSASPTRR